jgi:hypothetical protein
MNIHDSSGRRDSPSRLSWQFSGTHCEEMMPPSMIQLLADACREGYAVCCVVLESRTVQAVIGPPKTQFACDRWIQWRFSCILRSAGELGVLRGNAASGANLSACFLLNETDNLSQITLGSNWGLMQ